MSAQQPNLQNGDLVFQLGAPTPMSQAIASATDAAAAAPVVHVGIYAVIDSVSLVIEASPGFGVTATLWQAFIADAGEHSPCIKVMRIPRIDPDAVIQKALTYLGRSYDRSFAPGDEELYCSELVYECCLDADGNHIFQTTPMNFLAPDGTLPEYWEKHFRQLGIPVPQGVPGTNPAAISASPGLIPIAIF